MTEDRIARARYALRGKIDEITHRALPPVSETFSVRDHARAQVEIANGICDLLNANWQPIEMAPRDKSWFVAMEVDGEFCVIRVVHYMDECDTFPAGGGQGAWSRAPTLFVPLPELLPDGTRLSDKRVLLPANDRRPYYDGQ